MGFFVGKQNLFPCRGSIELGRFTNIWLIVVFLYFFCVGWIYQLPWMLWEFLKRTTKKRAFEGVPFWIFGWNVGLGLSGWPSRIEVIIGAQPFLLRLQPPPKEGEYRGSYFNTNTCIFGCGPPPLRMQGRNIWRFSSTPEKQDPLIKPQPTCIDMNVVHDQWSYFRRWCWFLTDSTMVNHHYNSTVSGEYVVLLSKPSWIFTWGNDPIWLIFFGWLNHYQQMGVSKNRGTPKWMVYMENAIKMDDLGVPLFLETSR